jgi:hypothetical protein
LAFRALRKLGMNAKFMFESLKRRDLSEDQGVDEMIILKMDLGDRVLLGVYLFRLAQDGDVW